MNKLLIHNIGLLTTPLGVYYCGKRCCQVI